jgi:hypothetical protein
MDPISTASLLFLTLKEAMGTLVERAPEIDFPDVGNGDLLLRATAFLLIT